MKYITLERLYTLDFTIRFVNCLKQFWKGKKIFAQNKPKDHTLLVYLHHCSARYTALDGETLTGHNGSVFVLPRNVMYSAEIFDLDPDSGCTIGINLHLYDRNNEELLISDKPILLHISEGHGIRELFEQINNSGMDDPVCTPYLYSDLYRLLGILSGANHRWQGIDAKYASIASAITHLRSEDAYFIKIADLAKECGVSESFLCRRFKQYSGLSPVQYIQRRKLHAAKQYLKYSDMSLEEIAYRLNYTDAAYFCKVFHRDTGMTPTQYRKQVQG